MTYGRLWYDGGVWKMTAEPHVAMWAKRIFRKIPTFAAVLSLPDDAATCRDLEWFLSRFPLEMSKPDAERLRGESQRHVDHIDTMRRIIDADYTPREFDLALPAREYQRRAAELYLGVGGLLLADDVGLGKTASAICSLTDKATLPAVVVCIPHLQSQWLREINRFAPDLHAHIIRKRQVYPLPKLLGHGVDVLIISYHKLCDWANVLAEYVKSVIFDEAQELRHAGTNKYLGAKQLADAVPYKLGLSATPIYNFGGEMFNVLEVLRPGILGSREEFVREWCTGQSGKERIKQPAAFGSWLREQHVMLRRTRKDVSRELPALQKITQSIDADEKALDSIKDAAGELARIILSGEKQDRGAKFRASEEFNTLLRQATGIAKAPYAAAFVKMLLENGEPVVLFGWHRAVYDLWREQLRDYAPAFYTGEESAMAKQAAAERFGGGDTNLLIVSLRSGAGLDGLQRRCRTVVFGELDWSPGVHEQCIGRVYRDGQAEPVAAYFLLAESGSDPFIAEVLGLKRDQIEGVRGESAVLERIDDGSSIKRLAETYLKKGGDLLRQSR